MSKTARNRRILIVGEGRETEYNYFVGFRNRFADELAATATAVRVARGKGGNARNIVENAIHESRKFDPDRRLGDQVYLLLDTEGVGRAPELPGAEVFARKHKIEIIYSCPSFEYWLLCHFPKISRAYFADCASVVTALEKKWKGVSKSPYEKADQELFERVADSLARAREQALAIDLHHIQMDQEARRTNPSSQVYELIARLIGVRAGERCPISGEWRRIQEPKSRVSVSKGDIMPEAGEGSDLWIL